MATPKIAMIPTAYKAGKLYSQLPVDGVGDFDVTRSGVSTRVNQSGLIEEVAANTPRLDYSGGGCPSLLTEPSRENLITHSEDFSDAAWSKLRCSLGSQIQSPDGTVSAYKVIPDTQNNKHQLLISTSSYTDATVSFFAKAAEKSKIRVDKSGWGTTTFDLLNEVVVLGSGTIEDYGNGWYRCSASYVASPSQNEIYIIVADDDGSVIYSGNDSDGIYIWGVQLEEGSFPTSYIPTNGSTETRGAESITGAGDANSINSSEGVLVAEIAALADDETNRYISLSDGTNNNRIVIRYTGAVSNNIGMLSVVGGVSQASENIDVLDITLKSKVALKYKTNDYSLWIDGIKVIEDTSALVPSNSTLDRLSFASGASNFKFEGKIKYLAVHDTALTDLQLEAETGFGNYSEMANQLEYTIE